MKIIEMTSHQKKMYFLMDEIMCEIIGGFENSLEDYALDTEEYKEAEAFLTQGHDELAAYFYDEVMSRCKAGGYSSHARFAGGDFLRARIDKRLKKWDY